MCWLGGRGKWFLLHSKTENINSPFPNVYTVSAVKKKIKNVSCGEFDSCMHKLQQLSVRRARAGNCEGVHERGTGATIQT